MSTSHSELLVLLDNIIARFDSDQTIIDDTTEEIYSHNKITNKDQITSRETNYSNLCNGYITDCIQLEEITQAIHSYKGDINTGCNIHTLLNSFYHLLFYHSSEDEFQFIYDKLNTCLISNCKILRRGYRSRDMKTDNAKSHSVIYNSDNPNGISMNQILDKIHCYYCHAYDMNYRISNQKKLSIMKELKINSEEKNDNYTSINPLIIQKIDFKIAQKLITQQPKPTQKVHRNKYPLYGFGQRFFYFRDWRFVPPSHSSYVTSFIFWPTLKLELLNNKLATLNMSQFNVEMQKMKIYFMSRYRKKYYSTLTEHELLALMVYCNFTDLQSVFTKTYYQNIENHTQFGNLAEQLQFALEKPIGFEQQQKQTGTIQLYHGIGDKLAFVTSLTANIFTPLSTTTSFAVAAHFSNENQGLIVEFKVSKIGAVDYTQLNKTANVYYFPTNWLSDYPGEQEHLFVQSAWGIQITNIIDPTTNTEYERIFRAISILRHITAHYKWDENVSKDMQSIITAIIHHQLWQSNAEGSGDKYLEFKSLNEYARDIINKFCEDQEHVEIKFTHIITKHRYFRDVLFHKNMNWINLELMTALFPNITELVFQQTDICLLILEDVLSNFKSLSDKFNTISILNHKITPSEVCNAAMINKFKDNGIKMTVLDGWCGFVMFER